MEEKFGFLGSRIAGKSTSGQIIFIALPKTLAAVVKRWLKDPKELDELRDSLQSSVGAEFVYVEKAEVRHRDTEQRLEIQFRYPFDAELPPIEKQLQELSEAWLKNKLLPMDC